MNSLEQLDRLCTEMGVPPASPPESFCPVPDVACYRCDFRRLPLEDGSADAIVTDVPWETRWLRDAEEFAAWCAAKLRPGGIMSTMYTARNLDKLMAELGKHLHYVWTCTSPMHGATLLRSPYVTRSCTLCLVYTNTDKPDIHRSPCDLLPYSWMEKRYHEHQQSLPPVQYLVEHFSKEQALIVDPCSGGWTTMEACVRTGRRFAGSDVRRDCLDKARRRFSDVMAA